MEQYSGWTGRIIWMGRGVMCGEGYRICGATFKERYSEHFVFKFSPPALRLLSTVPKNSCHKSGSL
jgi:hypothetical protein